MDKFILFLIEHYYYSLPLLVVFILLIVSNASKGGKKINSQELINLSNEVKQNGYSIIPTKIYTKDSLIKLEIALAKGKKIYDKRADIKNREWERSKDRILKKR